MAQGRTNVAIARQLFVSESAVSKHVASIFTKFGLAEDPSIDRRVTAALRDVMHAVEERPSRYAECRTTSPLTFSSPYLDAQPHRQLRRATRPRRVQCLKPRRRQAIARAEIMPSR
jgi:hypothetical protein